MKPSNEELEELIKLCDRPGGASHWLHIEYLARAELQRRQQPASGRGQSQWVPVSERKPQIVRNGDGVNSVLVYMRDDDTDGFRIDVVNTMWVNYEYCTATHWMPLPEPPTC